MLIIGITGGVGCGKSTVLDMLKNNLNCEILKTDDVAKELYNPGKSAYNMLIKTFGSKILDKEKCIDKKLLSNLIFNDENNRKIVNDIVHPLVRLAVIEKIDDAKKENNIDFLFIESALLLEANYDILCNEVWYIYADEKVRKQRLKDSRGYSEEKIQAIFNTQLPEEKFNSLCDKKIDNSLDENNTYKQLKEILKGYGKL